VAYLLGAINATDSSEDKSQLLGFLALEYQKFEMHSKELQALEKAVELSPGNPMLRIELSGSFFLQEQYEKAREIAVIAVSTS
jgi:hypothetical protein